MKAQVYGNARVTIYLDMKTEVELDADPDAEGPGILDLADNRFHIALEDIIDQLDIPWNIESWNALKDSHHIRIQGRQADVADIDISLDAIESNIDDLEEVLDSYRQD